MSSKNTLILQGVVAIVALIALMMVEASADLFSTRADFSSQVASTGNYFSAADSFQKPAQPIISNINAMVTCNGATVSWDTDLPADSVVEWSYTPGGPYSTLSDSSLVTSHSIPIAGLASGANVYHLVSSTTGDGHSSTSGEAFFSTLSGGKPNLTLGQVRSFWDSYADYSAGLLSVEYRISNPGGIDALQVTIIDAHNSSGVLFVDSSPWVADIAAGANATFLFHYSVGSLVTNFKSMIYATAHDPCGILHEYPGAHPGV